MKRIISALVLALALRAAGAPAVTAQQAEPRNRSPLTILQINDVYQTGPVDGLGGLARVATIKKRLQQAGRTPLLMLAGDFLSSSVASTVFKGEQMIAALNATGLDLVTLGNHEFDFGDDLLIQRMKESKFQWVVANVLDSRTGTIIGGASPYVIRTYDGMRVGVLGLCLDTSQIATTSLGHTTLVDPLEAAARYIPEMKKQGVDAIVALTHLSYASDRLLAERFPEIDVIVGGHEHFPIVVTEQHALISKAGSDARFVARIDLGLRPASGTAPAYVEKFFELMPVTLDIPEDPATAAVVKSYDDRLGPELRVVVGETAVPLDATSVRTRASEMPIGNLFADAMREDTGADVAVMNSGSIRGDRIYPAGQLTRETVLAMHPYGNIVTTVQLPGRVLLAALNNAVSKLPNAAGQFPQVSGMSMTVDMKAPANSRVKNVKVGTRPLELDKMYVVAMPDYILMGGDDYLAFAGQKVLLAPESGPVLVNAIGRYLAAHSPVSPRVEGRIVIER